MKNGIEIVVIHDKSDSYSRSVMPTINKAFKKYSKIYFPNEGNWKQNEWEKGILDDKFTKKVLFVIKGLDNY